MRTIKRIFIHCTAGPQTQSIQTIKNYWKKVRGWKDPGYHYIIKANGEIVQLQPEEKPSNGVAGYNSTSINVCYIGGVDGQGRPVDNRTDAQKTSLATLLKDLHSRYPDAEILGHRDVWGSDPRKWKKMCPCFDVKTWWNGVLAEDNMLEQTDNTPTETVTTPQKPINTTEDIEHPTISTKPAEKPVEQLDHPIITILKFFFKFLTKLFK